MTALHASRTPPWRRVPFSPWASALLALALSACGGGGGDAGTSPAPAPPQVLSLDTATADIAGEWVNPSTCAALSAGQSGQQMVRLTRSSDAVVDFQSGVLVFANATCGGSGTPVLSPVGTVTFKRAERNASVTALWGSWRTITGSTSAVAWAKTASGKLCLLGDETPSILPTLDQVAQAVSTPEALKACYTKR